MSTVENRHPIRIVSRRTGLSSHVIRVWEKRYAAVVPQRTDSNRRLYSDTDIERLNLLQRAIDGGRSIGQIAPLETDALRALLRDDKDALAAADSRVLTGVEVGVAELLGASIEAVEQLDGGALFATLQRARVALSRPALLSELLTPLLVSIGNEWRDGRLRIGQEHLASSVIRTFLGMVLSDAVVPPTAPRIALATLSGQLHELGAMCAGVAATQEGWRVLYLGASLPAEEIASVAQREAVSAVGLSIVYVGDERHLQSELANLRRFLPETPIIAGGDAAMRHLPLLAACEISCETALPAFRHRLAVLPRSAADGSHAS